jgi:hypothetical protein
MRRVTTSILTFVLLPLTLLILATACAEENDKVAAQRDRSIKTRADTFERAERAVPVPKTENFPLRALLAEMTIREDKVNYPWYIYILGDNGNTIGYYVGKTVPVNKCNFLSSTESVRSSDYGNLVLTAPSLDGIYYGGSGASGACDAWVFQDVATSALITIRGVKFYTSDRPLRLEADAITVKSGK